MAWTLAVLGILVQITALFAERRGWFQPRKQISYRVRADDPVVNPGAAPKLTIHDAAGDVLPDPSWVSIQVENTGRLQISNRDQQLPITFGFGGREVKETFPADGTVVGNQSVETINQRIANAGGLCLVKPDQIEVPKIHMNPGDRFGFNVLLAGVGTGVVADAFIAGGLISEGNETSRRRLRRNRRLATTLAAALLGSGVTIMLVPKHQQDPVCAQGNLTVMGSTAFKDVLTELADRYQKMCDGVTITVDMKGTQDGLQRLAAVSAGAESEYLAMSDGKALSTISDRFQGQPTALVYFSVVVNRNLGLLNLSQKQVQDIFAGTYQRWSEVDPTLKPIPIRIVGRGASSGTRIAFEKYVLGQSEGVVTSTSCTEADRPATAPATGATPPPAIRCEQATTEDQLNRVGSVDGAIGYADAGTATTNPNVARIQLDHRDPSFTGTNYGYSFWSAEWAYSLGNPNTASLLSKFRQYIRGDAGQAALREKGYEPCTEANKDIWTKCSSR